MKRTVTVVETLLYYPPVTEVSGIVFRSGPRPGLGRRVRRSGPDDDYGVSPVSVLDPSRVLTAQGVGSPGSRRGSGAEVRSGTEGRQNVRSG